jgi:hypothetical protein
MSIKIMSMVWDVGPPDKAEILVLLAIADYCNDAGECWPSVASIAQKARMTERGVQKICARLCDTGWLRIDHQAGRKGCNLYTIKAPNAVHPEPRSPRTPEHIPPNPVPKTPEPRSPEPSGTIKEPSDSIRRDPVADELRRWASPQAVASFIAYRKKSKGKALTETAAKRLGNTLQEILRAGGDPDDALGMAEERGWLTVKPEWYFKEDSANARRPINGHSKPNFSATLRAAIEAVPPGTPLVDRSRSDPFAKR